MESTEKSKYKALEDPQAIARYDLLKGLGKDILGSSNTIQVGKINESDVDLAKIYLEKGASQTNPPVWSSYWEHVIIAPKLGEKITESLVKKGVQINVAETVFLLWLHDIGRLVVSAAYLRNDFVGDRLLIESGVPHSILKNLPSVGKLMEQALELKLDEEQLKFQKPLTNQQELIAHEYFSSLNPMQRVVSLADNLGKRGSEGLFTLESFLTYLKTQESRYQQVSQWASIRWAIPRRQAGAVLQAYTIEKIAQWLTQLGVNLLDIHQEMVDYGPKFIVVARHGELENPGNIVYNRDSIMAAEDRIHISQKGKEQMKDLGLLLKKRGFRISRVEVSPESRAQESASALNEVLNTSVSIDDKLDEIYAPGPYLEKMTLDELAEIGGDVCDDSRWGKYKHEQPDSIITRMQSVFWQNVKALKVGETGVLISHGDPIGWLVNTLSGENKPQPKDLRRLLYPAKGEGILAVIGSDNRLFTLYSLLDQQVDKKIGTRLE